MEHPESGVPFGQPDDSARPQPIYALVSGRRNRHGIALGPAEATARHGANARSNSGRWDSSLECSLALREYQKGQPLLCSRAVCSDCATSRLWAAIAGKWLNGII